MPEMLSDAARVRETQRENWTVAAPGWVQRRDDLRAMTRSITEGLIAAANIGPGMRVLDVACGVGDPSISIAAAVGTSGSVLGLDITPAMVDGAAAYAREHDIGNAAFRAIPREDQLGVDPGTFDAATCRWGLMFMADPAGCLRAVLQALRPGGRVAVSTWGPPERVPFMTLANGIAARHVDVPKPDPAAKTPFTIPVPEMLSGLLNEAGFADVRVDVTHTDVVTAPSPAEYWTIISEGAGTLVATLSKLDDATKLAIRGDVLAALAEKFGDGPVTLGGEVLIGSGVKRA